MTVRQLAATLAALLVVAAGSIVALVLMGDSPRRAFDATAPGTATRLSGGSSAMDSWTAMIIAFEDWGKDPGRGLYASFFEDGVKFQYPPSSLLVLDLLPPELVQTTSDASPGMPGRRIAGRVRAWAGVASQLATIALIVLAAYLLERSSGGEAQARRPERVLRWTLAIAIGCLFYPVVRGHALGQVQVFLNLLTGGAILAFLLGRPAITGVLLGVCCLVKPQLGLVLLWGVVRRHWHLTTAMAGTVGVGMALALARFGWQAHWDYLRVLREIGSTGEVFWANQSVNGLLHRFFGNGDPAQFQSLAYAPFDLRVYLATLASTALLLAAAFWPLRSSDRGVQLLDLACIILAATMASPVAWEHHYGVLLPILAATTALLLRGAVAGRMTGALLLAAFVAVASVVRRPELFFQNPVMGLLGSHLFFGALAIFALLVASRHRLAAEAAAR